MANPQIIDYLPVNGSVSLPLNQTSGIWIEFQDPFDVELFTENFFIEGPDTDQYIGPGLIELTNPDNVSQGDLDNFLKSPGYKGIVDGTFSPASGVANKIYFHPSHPLAPNLEYVAYLIGDYDIETSPGVWETVSGLSWTFQTGSGSIQELPSSISTSVLASFIEAGMIAAPGSTGALNVVSSTPADHSIKNSIQLPEIVVKFDKPIDPTSVTPDSVFVETLPVTDHPAASSVAQGELVTSLEVSGYQLKIKL